MMSIKRGLITTALASLLAISGCAREAVKQEEVIATASTEVEEPHPGLTPYFEHCASCHEGGVYKAPHRLFLSMMAPDAILHSMDGIMTAQSAALTDQQKEDVAEYIAGRSLESVVVNYPPPACEQSALDMNKAPAQAGWGVEPSNTRFQPLENGGLSADNSMELELKWAFAFPNAIQARSQPAVAGGTVFVGSQNGNVYALDAKAGCVRWTFRASAEVRTAIVISPWSVGDTDASPKIYFGDILARAYAVDARSGELLWTKKVDDHPNATITGTPTLVGDRLFVPVSSLEVVAAVDPEYACCTFRGSMVALNASSGDLLWKSYTIDDEPANAGKTDVGTTILAPSGAPIWNSPTVDLDRGQIYAGTGENYSSPAEGGSDAIIAFDMATGKKNWITQTTTGDAWNAACLTYFTSDAANCPEENGPDFDYSGASILLKLENKKDILVAGQKSGIIYGFNPDNGEVIWESRVGRGGVQGGVHFGMAAGDGLLYVPINDMFYPEDLTRYDFQHDPRPGIYALDPATGNEVWAQPADNVCPEDRKEWCDEGISAPATAIPGGVIAGHMDGRLRIYSATDGKVLWDFSTLREFETVSGEMASGGSMSGAGVSVADGMLYTNSGYGIYEHMPGNVLLAFGLK
ncbi:MAG: polyvinyl alcohol dehydrogenase (cytochrome) [Alcanivorax sp.]|jgi:polyvinyl alcohol dehydrogenase (cytochrome)